MLIAHRNGISLNLSNYWKSSKIEQRTALNRDLITMKNWYQLLYRPQVKKTHKKSYFQSKSREKKRNNELVELIFFSRSIWFCMEFSMKQKKIETLPSTDKRINSLKINTKRMNNQFNWWTHFHCNPINNLSIFVLIHVENDHHRPTYSIDYLKNDN